MSAVMQIDELETLLPPARSAIGRDLRLNLKRLLLEGALSGDEPWLALLATATSVRDGGLAGIAVEQLRRFELSSEQIQEAQDSAAMMAMLNTYYRFRHMLNKDAEYRVAGLRMTALAKPVLGKTRFEMLAFAVSVLNGCETCVRSHEQVLRDAGVSVEKIHDLARLAAVVKAWSAVDIGQSA